MQTAKGTGRKRRLADGGGLYLLISPNGSKSWVLRTVVHGRRCDIGLGGTAVVTLAAAREQAERLRRAARSGRDPVAERRQTCRGIPTFEKVAKQVHAAHAQSFKNEKHRKQWLASLGAAFAAFGAKPIDTVSSADLLALLSSRWLTTPETSRRVLQRLRVIFDWSKAQGFCIGENPTVGLSKILPKHRGVKAHHAALPYAEVPGFVQKLRVLNSAEPIRLALELTILCATRTSETLLATWGEVDLEAKTWTIPGSRMKAGVEHRIPLSDRCLAIFERIRAISERGEYVFPGRRPNRPLSSMAFLMALRRMKVSGVTAHGFRSSFRDCAAERTNAPRAVCEAALREELQFYLDQRVEAELARGVSEREARVIALRALGGRDQVMEACRDARGVSLIEDLIQDVSYGARVLRREAGFTAVIVLTLAVGIGANTAVFSVVDGVLLRPVPFQQMDRLVMVWGTDRNSGTLREPVSVPDFLDFEAASTRLLELAAFSGTDVNFAVEGMEPVRAPALTITGNLLPMVGMRPLVGALFELVTSGGLLRASS